jgi:hypothetical protein
VLGERPNSREIAVGVTGSRPPTIETAVLRLDSGPRAGAIDHPKPDLWKRRKVEEQRALDRASVSGRFDG